jgi:hypothetical protein
VDVIPSPSGARLFLDKEYAVEPRGFLYRINRLALGGTSSG